MKLFFFTSKDSTKGKLFGFNLRSYMRTSKIQTGSTCSNDPFFRVGGGISNNDFVLEIMSSLTCQTIDRPSQTDMSTLGAAFLAGLAAGMI